MQTFSGAWPALVTPYTAENEVDEAAIDALIDYLLDKQVGGFYLCGSTGQGIYQSVAERKRVTARALQRIEGRVVDSENHGVPHILVLAQPTVKGRAIRRAFTNSKGYFMLRALHPERYELRTGDAKHGVEIEAGTKGLVLREESR